MIKILEDNGYEVPPVGKNSCCLFHEETRASARLFDSGQYHCWSANCGVHFSSPIDLIMHIQNCDFKEALKIAEESYGYKKTTKSTINLEEFHSLQDSIKRKVIQQKPEDFLRVYKTLDELVSAQDLEKMKKLYYMLSAGQIK